MYCILAVYTTYFLLFTSTLLLLNLYHLSTSDFSSSYGSQFIPTVGTFHSHGGNVSFPAWEHFIPNVGIPNRPNGNNAASSFWNIEWIVEGS